MKDSIINYEIAFANFTQKIKKMTVGNIKKTGIKKIAKPVLLLDIIKGIENGTFKQNCFEYEQLDMIYEDIFKKYADMAKQTEHTPAYYPFYYLQSSDFWKLSLLTPNSERKTSTPSANWIRRNIEYAYINPVLWEMLQLKEYRSKLAEFIIEEKIKTATARSRSIMRILLNWLVAI